MTNDSDEPKDPELLEQTVRLPVPEQMMFGRYRLIRIVGRGGMGVVWLARDEELDRDVALKFLPESFSHDKEAIAALKRETRFSLELTHPNIVRTYDFVHDDLRAAIAMEFIDGRSLSALKSERPNNCFEVSEIEHWVEQLCAALDYAHTVGKVVHQDLKPANLMLNSKGQLKVTDFGIARTISDSVARITAANAVSGTLVYMSPHQLNGRQPTSSNDIYSLGATLYDLLTSKPPFHTGALYQQIEKQVPDPMSKRRAEYNITGASIPKAWEATVAACLAKLPEQRPASAGEVAARLGLEPATFKHSKVRTADTSLAGWFKRRPGWAAGLAAIAVAVVGLGLHSWQTRNQTSANQGSTPSSAPTPKPVVERPARKPAATQVSLASLSDRFTNSVGMVFVRIPGLPDTYFSIWETRLQDFKAFVDDTGHDALSGVVTTNGLNDGKFDVFGGNWKNPGWKTDPDHPVSGMSRDDAAKFCAWLSELEASKGRLPKSHVYRLPKDTEWSFVVGLPTETGTSPEERDMKILGVYPWGGDWPPPLTAGNYKDARDGFMHTSPVGSFPANKFGLFDLGGNVWEWCADPFNEANPGDGTLRGGSFVLDGKEQLLSSRRRWPGRSVGKRNFELGFRCVLAATAPAVVPAVAPAAKAQ